MDPKWTDVLSAVSGLLSVLVAAGALVFAVRAAQRERAATQDSVLQERRLLEKEQARRERLELLLDLSREVSRTLALDATETGVSALRRATLLLKALPEEELPITRYWVARDDFPSAQRRVSTLARETNLTIADLVTGERVSDELGRAIACVGVRGSGALPDA